MTRNAVILERQPCGHPVQAIQSSDEGTSYCGWCAEVTRLRSILESIVATADEFEYESNVMAGTILNIAVKGLDATAAIREGNDRNVIILELTLGNRPGDVVKIEEETDEEIYYYDGFDRWCYLNKSEEGRYWVRGDGGMPKA